MMQLQQSGNGFSASPRRSKVRVLQAAARLGQVSGWLCSEGPAATKRLGKVTSGNRSSNYFLAKQPGGRPRVLTVSLLWCGWLLPSPFGCTLQGQAANQQDGQAVIFPTTDGASVVLITGGNLRSNSKAPQDGLLPSQSPNSRAASRTHWPAAIMRGLLLFVLGTMNLKKGLRNVNFPIKLLGTLKLTRD